MAKSRLNIFLSITIIFLLFSNSYPNFTKSVEAGLTYTSILTGGSFGALSSYEYAVGFNLGFNLHSERKSTINFQFSYNNFIYSPYYQDTDILNNFSHKKNTQFHNFSVGFRVHLLNGLFSPFLTFRPGLYLISWGELYDPKKIEELDYTPVDAYAPEWNKSSIFYFGLGLGFDLEISKKFGLIIEGYLALSNKSINLMPVNISLKYNL